MLHVDEIEADDCAVDSDIQFRKARAEQEWAAVGFEEGFEAVQRAEDVDDGFFVDSLVSGEAGFVNAGVEVRLHPGGDGVNRTS